MDSKMDTHLGGRDVFPEEVSNGEPKLGTGEVAVDSLYQQAMTLNPDDRKKLLARLMNVEQITALTIEETKSTEIEVFKKTFQEKLQAYEVLKSKIAGKDVAGLLTNQVDTIAERQAGWVLIQDILVILKKYPQLIDERIRNDYAGFFQDLKQSNSQLSEMMYERMPVGPRVHAFGESLRRIAQICEIALHHPHQTGESAPAPYMEPLVQRLESSVATTIAIVEPMNGKNGEMKNLESGITERIQKITKALEYATKHFSVHSLAKYKKMQSLLGSSEDERIHNQLLRALDNHRFMNEDLSLTIEKKSSSEKIPTASEQGQLVLEKIRELIEKIKLAKAIRSKFAVLQKHVPATRFPWENNDPSARVKEYLKQAKTVLRGDEPLPGIRKKPQELNLSDMEDFIFRAMLEETIQLEKVDDKVLGQLQNECLFLEEKVVPLQQHEKSDGGREQYAILNGLAYKPIGEGKRNTKAMSAEWNTFVQSIREKEDNVFFWSEFFGDATDDMRVVGMEFLFIGLTVKDDAFEPKGLYTIPRTTTFEGKRDHSIQAPSYDYEYANNPQATEIKAACFLAGRRIAKKDKRYLPANFKEEWLSASLNTADADRKLQRISKFADSLYGVFVSQE